MDRATDGGGCTVIRPGLSTAVGLMRLRLLAWLARRYVGGSSGLLDLSAVSRLPDSLLWPLKRTGLDPVDELGRVRAQEPVSRLPVPLGFKAWLVTGYDEVRTVLGSVDGFSND